MAPPSLPPARSGAVGRRVALATLLALFAGSFAAAREKSDVVRVSNGDWVSGEVKQVDRGLLMLKTDFMGTIYVRWEEVLRLTSPYAFEVELESGERFFGSFVEASADGKLKVAVGEQATELELADVVRIAPIQSSFWQRLDGSLSVGFNYTKSSGVGQFNLASSTTYRTREFLVSINMNAVITSQEDDTTSRENLTGTYRRFRKNRWFVQWLSTLESNEELGIDARGLIQGGGGRYLIQDNHVTLALSGGLLATQELLSGSSDTQSNLEVVAALNFDVFRFRSPKTDITTVLQVYPSLTVKDRVRSEFDFHVRQELVRDFFLEVTLYSSLDTQPPNADAAKSDYGIVTSLGWTY